LHLRTQAAKYGLRAKAAFSMANPFHANLYAFRRSALTSPSIGNPPSFTIISVVPGRSRGGRYNRALYDASVVEGVSEGQARALYAVVYAGGWRWEPKESSCYRSCHVAATSLTWKPAATPEEIQPVFAMDRADRPDPGCHRCPPRRGDQETRAPTCSHKR
jgi:hypothetical protein